MLPPEFGRLGHATHVPRTRTASERRRVGRQRQRRRRVCVNAAELVLQRYPFAGGQGAALRRPLRPRQHDDFLSRWGLPGRSAQGEKTRCRALLAGSQETSPRDDNIRRHVFDRVSLGVDEGQEVDGQVLNICHNRAQSVLQILLGAEPYLSLVCARLQVRALAVIHHLVYAALLLLELVKGNLNGTTTPSQMAQVFHAIIVHPEFFPASFGALPREPSRTRTCLARGTTEVLELSWP